VRALEVRLEEVAAAAAEYKSLLAASQAREAALQEENEQVGRWVGLGLGSNS
jgi:hypothetical protein